MNTSNLSAEVVQKTKKSTRISDDFETDFGQKTLESTRVSQVLRRMQSGGDIDLIFKNKKRKRYLRFLSLFALCGSIYFAYSFDTLEAFYGETANARFENILGIATETFHQTRAKILSFINSK